jgi:hypothetical protein
LSLIFLEQIMSARRKVRVATSFPPGFFDGLTEPPLLMSPGETLEIDDGEKSNSWPEFVLVVNKSGGRGWVPRRYLKYEIGGKKATVIKCYNTATLNPSKGDTLTVLEEDMQSGWVWCRTENGEVGWFAIDHLESY